MPQTFTEEDLDSFLSTAKIPEEPAQIGASDEELDVFLHGATIPEKDPSRSIYVTGHPTKDHGDLTYKPLWEGFEYTPVEQPEPRSPMEAAANISMPKVIDPNDITMIKALTEAEISRQTKGAYSFSKTMEDFVGSNKWERLRMGDLDTDVERIRYLQDKHPEFEYTSISTQSGNEVFFKQKDGETWYPVRDFNSFMGDISGAVGSVTAETLGSFAAQANPYLRSLGWTGRTIKEMVAQGGSEYLSQVAQGFQKYQSESQKKILERTGEVSAFAAGGELIGSLVPGINRLSPFNELDATAKSAIAAAKEEGVLKDFSKVITKGNLNPAARVRQKQLQIFSTKLQDRTDVGMEFARDLMYKFRDKSGTLLDLNNTDKIHLAEDVRDSLRFQTMLENRQDGAKYKLMREELVAKNDTEGLAKLDTAMRAFKEDRKAVSVLGQEIRESYLNDYLKPNQEYFRKAYPEAFSKLEKYNPVINISDYEDILFNDKRLAPIRVAEKEPGGNIVIDEMTGKPFIVLKQPAIAEQDPKFYGIIKNLRKELEDLSNPDVPGKFDLIQNQLDLLEPYAYPNDILVKGAKLDSKTQLARDLHKALTDARMNKVTNVPDSVLNEYKELNDAYRGFMSTREDAFSNMIVSTQKDSDIGEYLYNNMSLDNLSFLAGTLPKQKVDEIVKSYKSNMIWGSDNLTNNIRKLELNEKEFLDALYTPHELSQLKAIGVVQDQWNHSSVQQALNKDLTTYEFVLEVANKASVSEINNFIKHSKNPEQVREMLRWGVIQDVITGAVDYSSKTHGVIDGGKIANRLGKLEEMGMLDILFSENVKKSLYNTADILKVFDISTDSGASLQAASLGADLALHTLLTQPKKTASSALEIKSMNFESKLFMSDKWRSIIKNQLPVSRKKQLGHDILRTSIVSTAPQAAREWRDGWETRRAFEADLREKYSQ